MKRLYFIIHILCLTFFSMNAANQFKFGKVSMEEMKMKNYENDTSAHAVILFDIGDAQFRYLDGKGFYIEYNRYVRVKIFDKNAYQYANFVERLYKSENSSKKEKISRIKGYTYNLVDGKIEKVKLENDGILETEINQNLDKVTITMPQIKEGCVFELKYSIITDFYYNFPEWQFQYSIPVKFSQYTVSIPEYFSYNPVMFGYETINRNQETENEQIKISYYVEGPGGGSEKRYSTEEYLANVHIYEGKDIPAFKKEPYITAEKNYINRIKHELAYIEYPRQLRESYSNTWESVNEKLMKYDNFGLQLGKTMFFKDDLESITEGLNNSLEKIMAIHSFLVNKMKWNGENNLFTDGNLRNAYNSGSGNSADINLILVNMLNKAGVETFPVILSTRSNGLVHPLYPSISSFNYVIAYAKDGDKEYLLDATNKNQPYYLIPGKCINGNGRLISEDFTDWIDVSTNQEYELFSMNDLVINESGIFKGTLSNKRKKYCALEFRSNFKSKENEDDFIKEIEQDKNGLKIINYEFENLDSCYTPLIDVYDVEIEGKAMVMGDNIYFNPLLFDAHKSNIFKLEERKYPVDYNYPLSKTMIYKYKIPDNYEIDYLPKSKMFALPGNTGKFVYNIIANGNQISLTVMFNINRSIFLPTEYPNLKLFYDEVVKKESEQVVLKKIN